MTQSTKGPFKFCWMLIISLCVMMSTVRAETGTNGRQHPKVSVYSSAELLAAIEQALLSETNTVEDIKKRLSRLEILQQAVVIEVNAYNVQNAAHTNLLLTSATTVADLEKALEENRLAIDAIENKLKDFIDRRDAVEGLRRQTQNQIQLHSNQITEVNNSQWSASEKAALLKELNRLTLILTEKNRLLQELHKGLGNIIEKLEAVKAATQKLSESLSQQIKRRSARELLQKKHSLLMVFSKDAFFGEVSLLLKNIGKLSSLSFWADEYRRIKDAGNILLLLMVALVVAYIVGKRLRLLCLPYEERTSDASFRWRCLGLKLIRRSIWLFLMFFVFYAYGIFQLYPYRIAFFRLISSVLLIVLLTRWAIDFLKLWKPEDAFLFFKKTTPAIRILATSLRYLGIGYVVLQWVIGKDSVILSLERFIIEIGLIVWCISFWQTFWQAKKDQFQSHIQPKSAAQKTIMFVTYFIVLSALIIELAGYPILAVYWMISWAKSLAASFWALLFFNIIREWQIETRSLSTVDESETTTIRAPIHRWIVHLCWLLWFVFCSLSLLFSWSAKPGFFMDVYAFFSRPFAIGKITLNLMSLIFAALILFFINILTRFGRYFMTEKIFTKKDMEPGLQDSITTISIYLLWGLGLVMALGVLGVSTTSLAVVFGALSIGIGFGLQNIFNNFISGIILLLERPIQVGDAIEIGGVWAKVKKINIRATIVQTFDNASLIIPNSEFISSQVTNWSFKEPSMRRKVNVGVAYGSDVELVRKTLLEIANQTAHVMKKPKPDVIFLDHGDSALIFTLRYWTTVDYYYATSTDIRFAIDRLFKERNIEIAFPQRDIHIRSVVEEQNAAEKSAEAKNDD